MEGGVSRTVRDTAMYLSIVENPETKLPRLGFVSGKSRKRLKIALMYEGMRGQKPHPEVRTAIMNAAELCVELGHTVETAYDGPAALGLLQRYTPDVAFLDVGLPVMDGYELARRIREDRRFARTVLVAVTGYGQKRDQVQSREAGFDAHLVKPVDLRAIEEIIAREAQRP